MKTSQQKSLLSLHYPSLLKHMFIGAFTALVLMLLLILSVEQPDPAWSKYWMIRPIVVIFMAGAAGGFFYSVMKPFRMRPGWKGFLAKFICLFVYIVGIWMGSILGLDGTLWN